MTYQCRDILDPGLGIETPKDEALLLDAFVRCPPGILQPHEAASIAVNSDVTTSGTTDSPVGGEDGFADEEVAILLLAG